MCVAYPWSGGFYFWQPWYGGFFWIGGPGESIHGAGEDW